MKMVSAAKYAKAERELRAARSYGLGAKCKTLKKNFFFLLNKILFLSFSFL